MKFPQGQATHRPKARRTGRDGTRLGLWKFSCCAEEEIIGEDGSSDEQLKRDQVGGEMNEDGHPKFGNIERAVSRIGMIKR